MGVHRWATTKPGMDIQLWSVAQAMGNGSVKKKCCGRQGGRPQPVKPGGLFSVFVVDRLALGLRLVHGPLEIPAVDDDALGHLGDDEVGR